MKARPTTSLALAAMLALFCAIALPAMQANAAANDPEDPENPDCLLVAPADPLTPAGLATPYKLTDLDREGGNPACTMANPAARAFVQATIVDPAGNLSVYSPLVIDKGTKPASPPVVPTLPAGAVVGIWTGYNGNSLDIVGPGSDSFVDGLDGSLFGQFSSANGAAFFAAAKQANVTMPPLGTGRDGQPCPTVRDYTVVDQDQSDNVTSTYLLTANGETGQHTAANAAILKGETVIKNASDNRVVVAMLDPALGCTSPTAPDLADPGKLVTSLALNELFADQNQAAPIALIPPNNPMVLAADGNFSRKKMNLYRANVGQEPFTGDKGDMAVEAADYCNSLETLGPKRFRLDAPITKKLPGPDPGTTLHTFLVGRLKNSLVELQCADAGGADSATTTTTTTTRQR